MLHRGRKIVRGASNVPAMFDGEPDRPSRTMACRPADAARPRAVPQRDRAGRRHLGRRCPRSPGMSPNEPHPSPPSRDAAAVERDRRFRSPGRSGSRLPATGSSTRARARSPRRFVTELALIRSCSEHEAEVLAVECGAADDEADAAPGTRSTRAGSTSRKMRALVDLLGSAKPDVAAQIERQVLPHAGGSPSPSSGDGSGGLSRAWTPMPWRSVAPKPLGAPTSAISRSATG